MKRTAQEPGRPSPFLEEIPVLWRVGEWSPTHDTLAGVQFIDLYGTEQAPTSRKAVGKGNLSHSRRGRGSRKAA